MRGDSAINCKSEWKDHRGLGELPIQLYVVRTTHVPKSPERAIEVAALPVVASSLSGSPIGHPNVFGGRMPGSKRRRPQWSSQSHRIISLTSSGKVAQHEGFIMPLSGSVRRIRPWF